MSNIKQLRDGAKREAFYPLTTPEAVIMEDGRTLQEVFYEAIKNINKNIEGYIRVAGSSDPKLSFKQYSRDESGNSVFDIFYPCLVGNVQTGRCGEILHILQKLNIEKDLEGNARKIDSTEGELMICNIKEYYELSGHYTNKYEPSNDEIIYDVFLRSLQPFSWGGNNAVKVEKFGVSADRCVSHADSDGVTRMHSCYNPAWAGSYQAPIATVGKYNYTGSGDNVVETYSSTTNIMQNNLGLHSTDINLPTGEQRAMNNNTDTTKTYPFMNRTLHSVEWLWGNMVAEGGTFDLHNPDLFGSGFCSNDVANSDTYFTTSLQARNGMRYKDDSDTWVYKTFNSVTANTNASLNLNIDTVARILNSYRNPFRCVEAYRVLCYAVQNNIAENTWFAFNTDLFKWRSVDGFKGPYEGEATAVVFKKIKSKFSSTPSDGTNTLEGKDVEFIISEGLWHGLVTSVSESWYVSGLIAVQSSAGDYTWYAERDQTKLILSPSAGNVSTSTTYTFESKYTNAGNYTKNNSYMTDYSDDAFVLPKANGGGLHTYVGGYHAFSATNPSSGQKGVRAFRWGSGASYANLSRLGVFGGYAPSAAAARVGFGTCVKVV